MQALNYLILRKGFLPVSHTVIHSEDWCERLAVQAGASFVVGRVSERKQCLLGTQACSPLPPPPEGPPLTPLSFISASIGHICYLWHLKSYAHTTSCACCRPVSFNVCRSHLPLPLHMPPCTSVPLVTHARAPETNASFKCRLSRNLAVPRAPELPEAAFGPCGWSLHLGLTWRRVTIAPCDALPLGPRRGLLPLLLHAAAAWLPMH